ncbi:MAG: hypothetical protein KJ970_09020 [Candidatus Eisenbacteria bacterium]|uniref:Uncharacterized protein n=1 Tax=Eiseniibacteriota bacterium TaxID=2212470 RepID=A0A948WCM4_UNCEI|nr:hypothetical protein [Candidatus Eisenbacteria bacterium]MBU1948552.1 hypothetical protein [Candidatus Eisenbacteria bacterium]MBU2691058.1 hypothetical protein [Candidatus Eisenbacteria bacterium]
MTEYRYAEHLRRIHERLDLPQPVKSRIILEIAADMEELHRHYRESGLSEREAEERVAGILNISDEALADLIEVHQSPIKRFLDRLSSQAQSRWEQTTLIILLLFMGVTTGHILLTARPFADAGPMVWPVLGTSTATIYLMLKKIYTLFIKKDYRVRNLHSGLTPLLVMAGLNAFVGVIAFLVTLTASYLFMTLYIKPSGTGMAEAVRQSAAAGIVCLFAAVITGLIWFLLSSSVTRIVRAEADGLLGWQTPNGI